MSSLSRSKSTTASPVTAMPGASKRGVGSKVKQACRRIEQLVTKPTPKSGEPEPIDAFLNNGPQAPDRPPAAPPLPVQNAAPRPSPLVEKYKIPYSPAFNSDPRASSVQNEQRRVDKIAGGYVRPQDTIPEEDTPPPVPPKGKSAPTPYVPYSAGEYWRHRKPRPKAIHPNLPVSQSAETLVDPNARRLTLDLAPTSLSLPLGQTFASETEPASHLPGNLTQDGSQTLDTTATGTRPHSSQHPRPKKRQRSRSGKLQRAGLHIDVPDTILESGQYSPFSFMTKTPPAVASGSSKRPKSLHVRSHTAEELHFDAGHRPAPTQAKTSGDMYGELHALRAGRPGHKRASTQQNLGQQSQAAASWKVYAPKETRPSQYTPFNPKAVKQSPEQRQTTSAIFGSPKVTDGKAPRITSGILPQETADMLKNMFSDAPGPPAQLELTPGPAPRGNVPVIQPVRSSSYRSAKYRSPRAESVPEEADRPREPVRPPPVVPTRPPYPVTPTVARPEQSRKPIADTSRSFTEGVRVARTQTVKRTQARKVSIKSPESQKSQVKVDRLATPLPLGHTTQRQSSVGGDPLPSFYGFRGDEAATEHRRRYEERRQLRREQRQKEDQERKREEQERQQMEEERKRQEQEREQREAQRRWNEVNDGDLIDFRSASQETSSAGLPSLQGTVDQAFVFWANQEASLLD